MRRPLVAARPRERGFTLLELVLALSILAAMLVILFGGLRVSLRSWQRGEERAEALQHDRSLTQLLERALGGAQPYTAPLATIQGGAEAQSGSGAQGGAAAGSSGSAATGRPASSTSAQRPTGAQGGLSPTGAGLSPTGVGLSPAGAAAQQPVLLFKGEADRVSFVTASPPLPLPAPIAYTAVTLSMEPAPTPGLAIREKALPSKEPFEQGAPLLLDPTVTGLRFRYLREPDRNWEDQWDAADERALPAAVEVTITTTVAGVRRELTPFTIPIRATTP